jgi:hypothetical protein
MCADISLVVLDCKNKGLRVVQRVLVMTFIAPGTRPQDKCSDGLNDAASCSCEEIRKSILSYALVGLLPHMPPNRREPLPVASNQ